MSNVCKHCGHTENVKDIMCLCGHPKSQHSEFIDRAPTSKTAESPEFRHCMYGWSPKTSFACDCFKFRPVNNQISDSSSP